MSTENTEAPVAPVENAAQTEATAPEAVTPEVEIETVESVRKKAENRINRLENSRKKKDWQLAETNKQLAELNRKIQEYEAKQNQPKEPSEDDFDNYGDYLKAVARYKPQQEKAEPLDPNKIKEQAFQEAQQKFYYDQRVNHVAQQAQKAIADSPELSGLLDEYSDVLDSYPPAIEMAFLESDNAPAAFYALAKEGKLEQLAHMTPTRAAHEIALAQVRGENMLKASKMSKAPAPIQGAKPITPSGRDLNAMSGKELRKHHGLL